MKSSLERPDSIRRAAARDIPDNLHCMKERWARDTPIFGKKRFLPQNNDIPKRTVTVGGEVDSSGFSSAYPPRS
jgi:hypothetical protein